MGGRGSSSGARAGSGGGGRISTSNLPKLTGSEKQVAWANDIRTEYVNRLNKNEDFSKQKYPNTAFVEDSFYSRESRELLDNFIESDEIRKVFPERWRREVSAREDVVNDTRVSDSKNAISQFKKSFKPIIEYNLKSKTTAKYWIDNYSYLLRKK